MLTCFIKKQVRVKHKQIHNCITGDWLVDKSQYSLVPVNRIRITKMFKISNYYLNSFSPKIILFFVHAKLNHIPNINLAYE